jgi:BirA family biotin operon repressor/biotin-[acetyl-CoA-carboxylase] ligase
MTPSDPGFPPADVWSLETGHIGRRVLVFDQLPSTNDHAAALAADPANAGTAVVARFQSAGRGQHGRTWVSRPGTSLLMSVLVAPPPAVARPVILTAWAAVAVAEAVFDLTGRRPGIKWPNDLLAEGRKVCGILTERGVGTVVGIGLNLNQTADEFAAAGLPAATSLAEIAGRPFELRPTAGAVLRRLDEGYARLLAGDRDTLGAGWRRGLGLLGRSVVAELTDGTAVGGRVREIGFDGIELEVGDRAVRVLMPEFVRHVTAT